MQLLNIRFTFSCRTSHNNIEGKSPIVLRSTFRNERRDIFTGIYVYQNNWNSADQRISKKEADYIELNENLQLILRKAIEAFDELKFSRNEFTIDELVNKIRGREAKPLLLMEYLQERVGKIKKRVGTEIVAATYTKYKRSLSYIQDYLELEYRVKNLSLQKISQEFMEEYFQFLRNTKGIEHNTACKYIQYAKTLLLPPIKDGLIKTDPFYKLGKTPKPVYKEILTQEEINKITLLGLDDPDLDRKRDIFLFACYTGLAYIDLKQFNSSYLIQETDGSWYIRKPRQKTRQDSIIPLLPIAIRILGKYSFTNSIADFNWHVSSNQKMNLGLKYIAKRAGITKRLTMHLARHTFATTVTLTNGIPIETVSKMLGHANIKQTQHYAKVIPLKIKMDMEKIKDLYK